jgi:Holliday junction resolvase-like predicted endonuclease
MLSATQIGRAAEFLVCYTLQVNGIECHHANSTTDVIATVLSGRMIRVEVKSATTTKLGRSTYQFFTSKTNNSDWYALVALDMGMMLFMPVSDIKTKVITVRQSEFTDQRQAETLQQLGAET